MIKFILKQARVNIEIATEYDQENANDLAILGIEHKKSERFRKNELLSKGHLLTANCLLFLVGESVDSLAGKE